MAFWKTTKNEMPQDFGPVEDAPPAPEPETPKENHLSFDEVFGAIQEDLQQEQRATLPSELPLAEPVPEEKPAAPPPARQVNRKRDCDVHVRFSDSEMRLLKKRVARSGSGRNRKGSRPLFQSAG